MRRITALALTIIFSCMLMAPLFGPDADANLPPCCRRNGKHHCMMERLSGSRKGFTSITEKCPCFPAGTCAVYSPTFDPQAAQQFYAEVVCHPACVARAEVCYRLFFLRSHPKRGPPSPLA